MIAQSFRMLSRDWRAGELRLLLLAVGIAVAALSSVGFFTDRLGKALNSQARQLLAADAVFASDNPISEEFRNRVRQAGLQTAETVVFPSMVGATGEAALSVAPQLSSLKAVSAGYPLRGALRVADQPGDPGYELTAARQGEVPAQGTVWLDAQLLASLRLTMGSEVEIGASRFKVTRLIVLEPDRGTNFVNFAPRAMINLADLPATQLIQPGSRVNYRLLMAGSDLTQVDQFVARQTPGPGQRFEDLRAGRPELRSTLNRAEQFLALVAMLSALIAATAIALAARRFAQRHLDGCAVMRAIGLPQARMAGLLLLELLWIALGAALLGVVVGYLVHFALVAAVKTYLPLALPAPGPWPALQAALAGIILLIGFAGFPVVRLAGVSPLRVLRRDLGAPSRGLWIAAGLAWLSCSALLMWFAKDWKIAGLSLAGFAVAAVVFGGVAWGLVQLVSRTGRLSEGGAMATVRVMLASWAKRGPASIAQMVALAVSLMALLLLTVTRNDLLESWQKASPADAPNRFLINIQPDQQAAIAQRLRQEGLQNVELSPMIRGRLVKVNDQDINLDQYSERGRRMLDREFNLSYLDREPTHNETVQGRWINPKAAEVSVEEGIARTLNLKIGDRLAFDIAGQINTVTVVGLRKVKWDSMKVNFFMILSPAIAANQPQSFITALHAPEAKRPVIDALVRDYPNLTVFDTDNIVRQVQAVLNQVSRAVEFLFGFTLIAGILVLYAAQSAGQQERQRESALMRALGASRHQLSRSLTAELLLTGGLSGLMAGAGATAVGVILARQLFEFDLGVKPWPLLLGTIAGALAALAAGWWGLRRVVNAPPINSLRQE